MSAGAQKEQIHERISSRNGTRPKRSAATSPRERIDIPPSGVPTISRNCTYASHAELLLHCRLAQPAGESGAADSRQFSMPPGFSFWRPDWLTTPTAGTIALNTFQEAVRRRWMTALLAFAVVLLVISTFFRWMQAGEEQKFLRDFGIGFIIIMTLLMAIFLGVSLVPPEIERRTIFTILSKPVDRGEFLIGKFMGLCLTLLVNLVVMGVAFLISYAIFRVNRLGFAGAMEVVPNVNPGLVFELSNMARALVLQYGQLVIMSALAITLSLVVSGITAIVFCFLAYFGGQMSSYWEHLEQHASGEQGAGGLSGPVVGLIKIVYFVLPRLDKFEVRERLVNDMPSRSTTCGKR
jgi:hypothetical protein